MAAHKSGKYWGPWGWMGYAVALMVGFAGCGKSVDNSPEQSQEGVIVDGVGGFGTQCALTASRGDPKPVQLTAYNCAKDSTSMKLAAPLLPIILQADCMKKQILAYSVDGLRIENRWNALPDGRFFFTMYAGNASIAGSTGQSACETPLALEIAGLMNCSDRDHAEIQVDATWHLNTQVPGAVPHISGPQCAVPTDCSFHAFTALKQCG